MVKRLSRGVKKYIRWEKARIRKNAGDLVKQKELIEELYKKLVVSK